MAEPFAAYIDTHRERFIEELKAFMRYPSVSAQRDRDADTQACAEWLRDHFQTLGLEAELVDIGGRPIVRALGQGASAKRVLIYGHYDVQPEDPLDEWQTPPFEPTVKDGVLFGRGATDDKGQLFAHVKAVESLKQTEGQLPCTVEFLIEGEEESHGDALPRYIQSNRDALKAETVIVSDSTMYDATTPALTIGLRGIVAFEFTLYGADKDVHSGAYGGGIANPVTVLAQMLSQCIGQEGKVLVPGFYEHVTDLEAWEAESIRALGFDDQIVLDELKVPALHGESGFSTLERLWTRPTFEVNGIKGGYQGQGAKTIIPASATVKISCRLVPHQDPADICKKLENHLKAICPPTMRLEISYFGMAPPVVFDVKTPVFQAAKEALKRGFGQDSVYIRCGGSIPVVNTFAQELGCPVVLMGLGLDSDGPHSPNECFHLDSFIRGAKASAYLLQMMGG